jgi:hypothetical protein
MSMLTRYRRSGGFMQLLQLIETCNPEKQDKLLKNIQNEDPRWAKELMAKMLTMEKVLSWDESTLSDICTNTQELTLAVALHGFDKEENQKLTKMLSHSQQRKIFDLKSEKNPSPGEVHTAKMKIIENVRKMILAGEIYLKKIDPDLLIEDDIEEKLDTMPNMSKTSDFSVPEMEVPFVKTDDLESGEVKENLLKAIQRINKLNSEVQKLQRENSKIKQENAQLKQKIIKAKTFLAA